MIERTFPIGGAQIGAQIEVTFDWETGTPGIQDGYGENTGVCIRAGSFLTFIAFEVNESMAPAAWIVTEAQVNYVPEDRKGWQALALTEHTGQVDLGNLPEVCEAVTATWEQLQAHQAVEIAEEDVCETGQAVAELEAALDLGSLETPAEERVAAWNAERLAAARERLQRAEAKHEALKAAYEASYEEVTES